MEIFAQRLFRRCDDGHDACVMQITACRILPVSRMQRNVTCLMNEAMNTNSEVRNLTDEQVNAVTGGVFPLQECKYVGANAWEQWIADYFNIFL